VLPAHGAGSACGKALGSVPTTTFGYEAKVNPALKLAVAGDEKRFVDFILAGQPEPPGYFANMKHVNKVGPAVLGALPRPPLLALDAVTLRLDEPHFVILDTRGRDSFLTGHLHRSLFTPEAKFADFAGSYLVPEDEIVLLVEKPESAEEFVRQLICMGFEKIAGILPTSALAEAVAPHQVATRAVKFADVPALLAANHAAVLDVRKGTEFSTAHLRAATNLAHTRLRPRLDEVPTDRRLLVHCQSGLRAAGACAFLERAGREVVCVADSFDHAPQALLA
jgi:hydroxyacylglutathione hydrolase